MWPSLRVTLKTLDVSNVSLEVSAKPVQKGVARHGFNVT